MNRNDLLSGGHIDRLYRTPKGGLVAEAYQTVPNCGACHLPLGPVYYVVIKGTKQPTGQMVHIECLEDEDGD